MNNNDAAASFTFEVFSDICGAMTDLLFERFSGIDYLQSGTKTQKKAFHVLSENNVMEKLNAYSPILAGTVPLDIDIDGSDLDIICCFNDIGHFEVTVKKHFSGEAGFRCRRAVFSGFETFIANFNLQGTPVEVFGQNQAVSAQNAVRHMFAEYLILEKLGSAFKAEIRRLKTMGIKTEAAFAKLLGIEGDPYVELLNYSLG